MTGPIDPAMLSAVVAQMRALGVTKYGDIELGPDPSVKDDTDETQRTADAERRERERKQRIVTGASGGPRVRANR